MLALNTRAGNVWPKTICVGSFMMYDTVLSEQVSAEIALNIASTWVKASPFLPKSIRLHDGVKAWKEDLEKAEQQGEDQADAAAEPDTDPAS